ncbi:tripartite tricarboxylate transporter TctB family protein [uncultured Ilyobacter sp.]|uniref:tripartite tricarboxylate transporter TctB family protein n=1 Tax=uncultured Ilyobacter sp. TaxID=544433 RepID=UPI0029C63B0A|nr:tripartite tricarboxylate transporter TctB family protein [uncultured Ilyobacter sp.]
MGEIIFHVFLIAVMGIFYKESLSINTARMTDPIGPAGFPRVIMILAMILLVISLINTLKHYKENKPTEKEKIKELDPGFLALLGVIVFFVLTVNFTGFWFGAVIIISSVMWILNQREIKKLVLVTLVASLVFTFVFGKILSIPLPRGIAVFETLSYFIY